MVKYISILFVLLLTTIFAQAQGDGAGETTYTNNIQKKNNKVTKITLRDSVLFLKNVRILGTLYYNSLSPAISIPADSGKVNTTGTDNVWGSITFQANQTFMKDVYVKKSILSDLNYSTRIGSDAGKNNASNGYYNTFMGYEAGKTNTTGHSNIFTGYQAGYNNVDGYSNIFTGYQAGYSNATGTHNVAIGRLSQYSAGYLQENVSIGNGSLFLNSSGSKNTFIGGYSGNAQQGNQNVGIGYGAGYSFYGDKNVAIGYQAGANETGSNTLYIDNSNADANNALVYGDFALNHIRFNHYVETDTTDQSTFIMDSDTADGMLDIQEGNFEIWDADTLETKYLRIEDGATNKRMGVVTLVGGSKVVTNVLVTANTRIFLTSQVDGGTPGFIRVSARTAGASFTITSSSGTDTSVIAFLLIEPK